MIIRTIFYSFIVSIALLCSFAIGSFFFIIHNQCIDLSVLARYKPGIPSIVLDDEGNEWTRFQLDRREPITYDKIPSQLINAFMAAEDWNFFYHNGLSWRGIIRSVLVNIYHGRKVQGASTITQQLVKLFFFDSQKTFKRKIKEQLYAILVERQCTKEQIMEQYLNHVYFGCGIYGVEAASQRFWGKHALDVTINEAAMLAAIVKLPEHYCPLNYPLSAEKRRNIVLGTMRNLGFINQQEYDEAITHAVRCIPPPDVVHAPHVKEAIRILLEQELGKEKLYCGGLTIQTTLSSTIQRRAEESFKKGMDYIRTSIHSQADGALISMEVKTGAIKALIGGYDFKASKFNRALQAKRQIGSVFKPLIYATALEDGLTFADTDIDEPIQIMNGNECWEPHNWDKKFAGQITLAYSLARSNNTVTVKTFLRTDRERVINLAKKCHLEGPFVPYPSLALGCVDTTLKEATGMFNVLANHGLYVEPHLVSWVKNRWGTKIWRHTIEKERALKQQINDQVAKVLSIGMERIRKIWFKGNWLPAQAISKTGTTNDSRSCWFVGSTPTLTTAIYIGCDDNQPLGKQVYPLRTAFPIWKELYEGIAHPQENFLFDPRLKEIIIHEKTGKRLASRDQEGAIAIFV